MRACSLRGVVKVEGGSPRSLGPYTRHSSWGHLHTNLSRLLFWDFVSGREAGSQRLHSLWDSFQWEKWVGLYRELVGFKVKGTVLQTTHRLPKTPDSNCTFGGSPFQSTLRSDLLERITGLRKCHITPTVLTGKASNENQLKLKRQHIRQNLGDGERGAGVVPSPNFGWHSASWSHV